MKNLPVSSPATALSNQQRRNLTIRTEFDRQKSNGVRSAFIIQDLAYRYFLGQSTIESIVWKRGRYGATVGQPTLNSVAA